MDRDVRWLEGKLIEHGRAEERWTVKEQRGNGHGWKMDNGELDRESGMAA